MKRLIQAPLALLLVGCAALAQEPDRASRLVTAALDGSRAYAKLAHLSDRIGPRLSGSSGLERAVRWTAEELRRDGMDRVWTEKVMVPHWVRGVETVRIVAPVEHALAAVALGMSIPTPPDGITAEVLEVSSFEELKAAGERVKGKIVLYNRAIVANGGNNKDGYGAVSPLRNQGAIEAAKLGAVATLIRSLGTASFRLPHTGAMKYEDGVPKIPSAAIAAEDADLVHRLLAAGDPVKVRLVLGCATLPDAESANVIADLRGREHPEEIVVIGAHLDSWDLGTGAIDDGAGVAIVMETMRLLKVQGVRPRRTIRAVLFVNEENGIAGGKAYAATHAAELAQHVAAIESDGGGAQPLGFGVTAGPGAVEAVRAIVAKLSTVGEMTVEPEGGGADISPMKDAGVPQLGLRQDGTRYFDWHHTAADTLDKVQPEELDRNVAALAVMAYELADGAPLARFVDQTPKAESAVSTPPARK